MSQVVEVVKAEEEGIATRKAHGELCGTVTGAMTMDMKAEVQMDHLEETEKLAQVRNKTKWYMFTIRGFMVPHKWRIGELCV